MSARRYSKSDLALLAKDGLAAQLPEPPVRRKRKNEESIMQRAVISWWAAYSKEHGIPECLLFAIPNGSALGHGKEEYQVKQRQIRGKIMKLEGLRPGCPDLMLAVAKEDRYCGIHRGGLFLEMKLPNGVVAKEQTDFITHLRARNYACFVCRSLSEAMERITDYLREL